MTRQDLAGAGLIACRQSGIGDFSERLSCRIRAAVQEDLHLLLGRLQCTLTLTCQRNAALKGPQGIIERQIALFEALDERLELREGAFEIHRLVGCRLTLGVLGLGGSGHAILNCHLALKSAPYTWQGRPVKVGDPAARLLAD